MWLKGSDTAGETRRTGVGTSPPQPPIIGSGGGSTGTGQSGTAMGLATPDGKFPIFVWFQSASNAAAYAAIGVNTYAWMGSSDVTQSGLNTLKTNGIHAILTQQSAVLGLADQSGLWGWAYNVDEPDNAQQTSTCSGDCPCIAPSTVSSGLTSIKNGDPLHRPVFLNCGRCVGDHTSPDRGSACTIPDATTAANRDYPIYYSNADMASNDIYPINHGQALTVVADAADNVITYTSWAKARWQIIETTQIQSTQGAPTPAQTRCETWLALTHGANGIGYFCHIFTPTFNEAGLLSESAMKAQVSTTNAQIQRLKGPLLTQSTSTGTLSGTTSRVDWCVRDYQGVRYLFATAPNGATSATFTVGTLGGATSGSVTVIDESRTVSYSGGAFTDSFSQYDVHLYQLP